MFSSSLWNLCWGKYRTVYMHAGQWWIRLNDGPKMKLVILVGCLGLGTVFSVGISGFNFYFSFTPVIHVVLFDTPGTCRYHSTLILSSPHF